MLRCQQHPSFLLVLGLSRPQPLGRDGALQWSMEQTRWSKATLRTPSQSGGVAAVKAAGDTRAKKAWTASRLLEQTRVFLLIFAYQTSGYALDLRQPASLRFLRLLDGSRLVSCASLPLAFCLDGS